MHGRSLLNQVEKIEMKGKGIVNTYNLALYPEDSKEGSYPKVKVPVKPQAGLYRQNMDKRISSVKNPFVKSGSSRYARSSQMIGQNSGHKLARLAMAALPSLSQFEQGMAFEPVKPPSTKHINLGRADSAIGINTNFDRGFLAAMALKNGAFNLRDMLQPIRPVQEEPEDSRPSKDYEVSSCNHRAAQVVQ